MKALDVLLKRLEEQIDQYDYTYDVTFEYDKQFEDLIRSSIKEYNELIKPKSCSTCKYYHAFTGVCANDECPLCADFVDTDFGCIYHELKE